MAAHLLCQLHDEGAGFERVGAAALEYVADHVAVGAGALLSRNLTV